MLGREVMGRTWARLSITAKIWLSIGIFVVGFLLSTALQQVEGLKIEDGLRITAEVLFPAARRSHEANTAFQNMVKEFRDAVVIQDLSGLERGADEGRRAIESLKALAAIEGTSTGPVHRGQRTGDDGRAVSP